MTQRFGALTYLFTFAIFAISTHCAVAATHHKQTSGGKHAGPPPARDTSTRPQNLKARKAHM